MEEIKASSNGKEGENTVVALGRHEAEAEVTSEVHTFIYSSVPPS